MFTNQSAAAGASVADGQLLEAPAASSAQEANPDTDSTTDTAVEASSTQSVSVPANDNQPVAPKVRDADTQLIEEVPEQASEPQPELELVSANDNQAVEPLPTTGTGIDD